MNLLILALAGILVLTTLISTSRNSLWWVRVLDFPRLQLLFLTICTLALTALFTDGIYKPAIVVISLPCILYHLYWIYPYTTFAAPEVQSALPDSQEPAISILTANVLMTNRDANKLIGIVRDKNPDVLLTLESDKWWEEKLEKLVEDYPYRVSAH